MKPKFTATITTLDGIKTSVKGDNIKDLDTAVESSTFSSVELRISLLDLPRLAKLNVGAILLKGRPFINSLVVLDQEATTQDRPQGINPFFQGAMRFNGKALAKFVRDELKKLGYTFDPDTEELIFNFRGVDQFVVLGASRRLLNLITFSSTYTRRLNTNKKFKWDTICGLSRTCVMPVPVADVVADDDGEEA